MSRVIRRWFRLLAGCLPVLLVLVACSGVSGDVTVAAPPGETATVADPDEDGDHHHDHESHVVQTATTSTNSTFLLTINVEITDSGLQPATIHVAQGQRVQLVLRNRGSTEHHFRVQGAMATDLLWLSSPGAARALEESESEPDDDDDDHDHHHHGGLVPWRDPSPTGITPTGDEVHVYARKDGMDVIIFTASQTGTFQIQCPLHPHIVGQFIVS